MNAVDIKNWQDIQAEVLGRIHSRQWKPGDLIPKESDLAQEFGCARATVNRALRAVAESGLLDRRRKAGTRVTTHPVRKATLNIPIIRQEIEDRDQVYSYALIKSELVRPPADIHAHMKLDGRSKTLKIQALHMADGRPYVCEDRWVNVAAVPDILEADLSTQSANEWLVANAPFTEGDIALSATSADVVLAERLGAQIGDALFATSRTTWDGETAITRVQLTFHHGYRMWTKI